MSIKRDYNKELKDTAAAERDLKDFDNFWELYSKSADKQLCINKWNKITSTEKEIIDSIFKLKGKKTIIFATHNITLLEKCDSIVEILDNKLKIS